MSRFARSREARWSGGRFSTFRGLMGAVSIPDIAPPVLSGLTVDDTVSPLDVRFNLTEDSGTATVYWVLVPNGDPAPNGPEIVAGQGSSGAALGSGFAAGLTPGANVGMTADVPEGLNGAYDLHAVGADSAENLSNVVSATNLDIDATPDTTDRTPPVLSGLTVDDTVSPLDVRFNLTEDSGVATVYWVLVPNGDPAPNGPEIVAGQGSSGAALGSGFAAGLVPGANVGMTADVPEGLNGAYDLHAVGADSAGNFSNVVSASNLEIDTTPDTTDTTPPILADLTVDDTVSPLDVRFNLTEDSGVATVYWVLVPNGDPAPNGPEIVAGQGSSGGAASGSGFAIGLIPGAGVGVNSAVPDGLNGAYDLHAVGADDAGNLSNVVSATNLDIDTSGPVATITGVTAGDGQLSVDWASNEGEGVARIVAVPTGDTAPTGAEILAGQESGGAAADGDSGNITVSATGAQAAQVISGLTSGTAYDIYLAQEDAAVEPNVNTALSTNHAPSASAYSENLVQFVDPGAYLNFGSSERFDGHLLFFASIERPVATDWSMLCHSSSHNSRGYIAWDDSDRLRVSFEDQNNGNYNTKFLTPPDWTGTGRIAILATVDASSGQLTVWTKVGANAFKPFGSHSQTPGTVVNFDSFTIGKRNDLVTSSYQGQGVYRLAIWEGQAEDISDATVQGYFMNGDVTEDPAVSVAQYGIPHIDLNGDAADYAAGTQGGDWGTLSVGGSFSDV